MIWKTCSVEAAAGISKLRPPEACRSGGPAAEILGRMFLRRGISPALALVFPTRDCEKSRSNAPPLFQLLVVDGRNCSAPDFDPRHNPSRHPVMRNRELTMCERTCILGRFREFIQACCTL